MPRRRRRRRGGGRMVAAVLLALAAFEGGRAVGGAAPSLPDFPPAAQQSASRTITQWDPTASPQYYRLVGSAQVDQDLGPGQVSYAGLDPLGRAGQAAACVTQDLMEEGMARERQDMEGLEPSGWGHNEEVEIPSATGGRAYHGMFWNRSHLVDRKSVV